MRLFPLIAASLLALVGAAAPVAAVEAEPIAIVEQIAEEVLASTSPVVRQFLRGQSDGPVPFHYPAPPLAADFGLGGGR